MYEKSHKKQLYNEVGLRQAQREDVSLMPRIRRRLVFIRDLFFWIGVALAGGGLALVAASNSPFISHLERSSPPLSWMLAGGAIFAL